MQRWGSAAHRIRGSPTLALIDLNDAGLLHACIDMALGSHAPMTFPTTVPRAPSTLARLACRPYEALMIYS
jgi:hypothetical protein